MQFENVRNNVTVVQVPLMKTYNDWRAFSYGSAGVWDLLDYEVKRASSFKVFKDALK